MMDFTPGIKFCYVAKMKEFCKWNEGSTLVTSELLKKEMALGGSDLIRWAVLNASAHNVIVAEFHAKHFRNTNITQN